MCGRATLTCPVEDVAELFGVAPIPIGPPRFNIAPSQPMLAVRVPAAGSSSELSLLRWGLVPWWSKPDEIKRIGSRCVQARAETVERAPAFRDAFKERRCLVVVDGFYEWKTLPDGKRLPHRVTRRGGGPFAIAGVWDRWKPRGEGEIVDSCAVVTTRATGVVSELHDRMPLVVAPSDFATWLEGTPSEAHAILEAKDADLVVAPVSTWVNDVRHDDPRCIEPLAADGQEPGQIRLSFD